MVSVWIFQDLACITNAFRLLIGSDADLVVLLWWLGG